MATVEESIVLEVATNAIKEFNLNTVHPQLTATKIMKGIWSIKGTDNEFLFDVVQDENTKGWSANTM